MPTSNLNIKSKITLVQLIPPKPTPTRGRPFPLSSTAEWFIYPHGKIVYLNNLIDSKVTKEFRDHAYPVTVAKVSPSGSLIASADTSGTLKVWNLTDLSTKLDVRVLAGKVNDLTWSEDEKFIAVAGEGRETFGNVIKVEGGASFSEIVGPTKSSSSISISPTSSHLIIGSDDKSATIFTAQPKFKFFKSIRDHENFVQVVRFSPNGESFATAGADGNIFVYSTSTFDKIGGGKWHEAGVTAMEWISNEILCTTSADKTVKLHRVSDGTERNLISSTSTSPESSFEKQISGMTFFKSRNEMIILRLDGTLEIFFIDQNRLEEAQLSLGHRKGIVDLIKTKVSKSSDCKDEDTNAEFVSIGYDGNGIFWSSKSTTTTNFTKTFKFISNVQKLSTSTTAIADDKIINIEVEEDCKFPAEIVESFENNLVLLSNGNLQVGINNEEKETVSIPNLNNLIDAAAFSFDGKFLSISSAGRLDLYEIITNNPTRLSLLTSVPDATTGKISVISFNPSNTKIATGDDQRRVKIYNFNSIQLEREKTQWCNHSARIDTISWLDNDTIATSGVDGDILLWNSDANKIGPISTVKGAHSAPITKIIKLTEDQFISGGSDSCLRKWQRS